jgi:hypothetical protein
LLKLKKTKKIDQDASLKASARRAKKMIKRLIYSNCFTWLKNNNKPYRPVTMTLTFAENIQDLKRANREFSKFILRLNYEINTLDGKNPKQNNLKYLAVFELQKRGAIHYHIIFFNLPFINNIYDKIKSIWGNGIINVGGTKKNLPNVNKEDKIKKIIEYFTKYIQKSIYDNAFPNQKKYITSKGLLKPQSVHVVETINYIKKLIPDDSLVFKYDGQKDYNEGTLELNFVKWMNVKHYDLSKYPKIRQRVENIILDYIIGDPRNIIEEKKQEDVPFKKAPKDEPIQIKLPDF